MLQKAPGSRACCDARAPRAPPSRWPAAGPRGCRRAPAARLGACGPTPPPASARTQAAPTKRAAAVPVSCPLPVNDPLQQSLSLPFRTAKLLAPRRDGDAAAGELVHFLPHLAADVLGQLGGGIV